MPFALARLSWWQWLEPPVVLATLALLGLYWWVARGPGQRWFPGATPVAPRQFLSFASGLGVLYLGFGGPLDILADHYLFTAHMAQHVLETVVSAPLLLLGTPAWMVRPLIRWRPSNWVLRHAVRPVWALVWFNFVFGIVVWPPLYILMEQSNWVHFGVHAALLVSALAMWWPLLSPLPELPRLHPGARMLYLFADGIPMVLPLAMVTLDRHPLYAAVYAHTPRLWGLSQVADQQLGGALCLVVIHFVYGWALVAAFREWVRHEKAVDDDVIRPKLVLVSARTPAKHPHT